jgi:glycosyltransferase involved in cell wall biosynthesis
METNMPDIPLPRISIITPSYNQGQYLEETIRSVLSQGYPNLEYLIIDGGSSDNSVSIIEKYHPFITYWISEPDAGQSHAINKGLQRATGEIVAWINSDDQYCPGAFFTAAQYFMAHPDTGMLYGDLEIINSEDRVLFRKKYRPVNVDDLLSGYPIPQSSAFFRKGVIRHVGLLDETLHYAMDFDLWMRIFSAYPVDHIPSFLSRFRIHANSKTVSQSIWFHIDQIEIFYRLLQSGRFSPDISVHCVFQLAEQCVHLLTYATMIDDDASAVIVAYVRSNRYAIQDMENLIHYMFSPRESRYDFNKIQSFVLDYLKNYSGLLISQDSGSIYEKSSRNLIFRIPTIVLAYDSKAARIIFKKFIRMDPGYFFSIHLYYLLYRLYCPRKAQNVMKPYLEILLDAM